MILRIVLLTIIKLAFTICQNDLILPEIFQTVIKPWTPATVTHQNSALVFANLTIKHQPMIAEMDQAYNQTDPVVYYQLYINSLYNKNYFVDGIVCTVYDTKSDYPYPIPPFKFPSLVAVGYILQFNSNPLRKFSRNCTRCPGHESNSCQLWIAPLENGDKLNVYYENRTIYRMSINDVNTFMLDFEYFYPDQPLLPDQFAPPDETKKNCKPPVSQHVLYDL